MSIQYKNRKKNPKTSECIMGIFRKWHSLVPPPSPPEILVSFNLIRQVMHRLKTTKTLKKIMNKMYTVCLVFFCKIGVTSNGSIKTDLNVSIQSSPPSTSWANFNIRRNNAIPFYGICLVNKISTFIFFKWLT